jgi:ribulose-5-phosphate 4-epimerase/fuculose-1-phosphate aldolase
MFNCSFAAVVGLSVALSGHQTAPASTPESAGPVSEALLGDLVAANHILAHEGVFDAYGHISVRHPSDPSRYLLARSLAPALVTVGDIIEYDLDSNAVDARGRASVLERFIHGEIYKARADVRAVVHSHSATVIPFGITNVPLKPVFHMAAFLYPGVPIWDVRNVADPEAPAMLVRNSAIGQSLSQALGDKPVALMRGHGNVVVATDVRLAVRNAIYTEVNARLQTVAIGLGGPITYVSPTEGAAMAGAQGDLGRAWELWKRAASGGR